MPEIYDSAYPSKFNLRQLNDKYKLFNRISNFISDISINETIYLIIDEIEKSSEIFIGLIDYLFKNNRSKLFVVLSFTTIKVVLKKKGTRYFHRLKIGQ